MTFKSYAQNYEDYLLWKAVGDVTDGFYVDVGANDPETDSVSKVFAKAGWGGIEIEPLPHLARKLREKRPNATVVEAAAGAEPGSSTLYRFEDPGDGMSTFDLDVAKRLRKQFDIDFKGIDVPIRTLNDILKEVDPAEIHWLKVDVEGFEDEALAGLDLTRWRPWVMAIESTAAGETRLVHHGWEPGVLAAGYQFALFDGINRYYIADEHAALAEFLDRPVSILDDVEHPSERLRKTDRATLLAQRDELNEAHHHLKLSYGNLEGAHHTLQASHEDLRNVCGTLRPLQESNAILTESNAVLTEANRNLGHALSTSQQQVTELHGRMGHVDGQLAELHSSLATFRAHMERSPTRKLKDYLRRRRRVLASSLRRDLGLAPGADDVGGDLSQPRLSAQKRLKARVALSALRAFPASNPDATPRGLRKRLIRWAKRAAPVAPPAPIEVAAPAPIEVAAPAPIEVAAPAPIEVVTAESAPDMSGRLLMSDDYAVPLDRWDAFVDSFPLPPKAAIATGGTLVLISPDGLAGQRGHSLVFHADARMQGDATLRETLSNLPDQTWVCLLEAEDVVDLQQVDVLAQPQFAQAEIVLPDLAICDGDTVRPVLLPGVNYLHALNCDYFHNRFFARAGALRDVCAAGAETIPEIALALLRRAYEAQRPELAMTLDRPAIRITKSAQELMQAYDTVATAPTAILPGPDAPVGSDAVDVAAMGGVSVVICTKDKGFYIRQLVDRLLEYPANIVADVIIVSNNTSNTHALDTLQAVAGRDRVKLLKYEAPFHFSAQSNFGARHARGDMLLFLNDDIVPIGARWLEELMAPFVNPRTVATGPLLLYPDERIQHAGMFMGFNNVAGHVLVARGLPNGDYGYMAAAPRFATSVTGAVLLVRRSDFEAVNGFDLSMRNWIQDVDLCLRLSAGGGDIVYTPRSTLFHMESLSVRDTLGAPEVGAARGRELDHFHRRWGARAAEDRFYPALLSLERDDCRLIHRPEAEQG